VLGQDSLNNLIDLCCDCNEFQSTNNEDYPRHQMKKHPGRSGYSGLADIKEMGFKTQGKALGDLTTKMPTFSCLEMPSLFHRVSNHNSAVEAFIVKVIFKGLHKIEGIIRCFSFF